MKKLLLLLAITSCKLDAIQSPCVNRDDLHYIIVIVPIPNSVPMTTDTLISITCDGPYKKGVIP